ncbi:REP element-mobilizing transposase RayT [Mucilaginibacter sp. UYCu711]
MQNYRKTSHTTYACKYHIVWITKYRKKVMVGIVAERVRELLRFICKENEVEILKGHISKDHVHLFVSVPPHLAISKLVSAVLKREELVQVATRKQTIIARILG